MDGQRKDKKTQPLVIHFEGRLALGEVSAQLFSPLDLHLQLALQSYEVVLFVVIVGFVVWVFGVVVLYVVCSGLMTWCCLLVVVSGSL